MIREMLTAGRLVVVTLLVCVVIYPAAILGFAAVAAPHKRLGSLVTDARGAVVGSELVAQNFERAEYFWPRPSAVDYDAAAAGGSNLSPTNPLLTERATAIIKQLALPNGVETPAELVAASGSGLDPHISLDGALVQVPRIARSRGMGENELQRFVEDHAAYSAPLAVGGEPLLNVLLLNLALNDAQPTP